MRDADLIGRKTHNGENWRAWRMAFPEIVDKPDWKANIGNWIAFCPGVSPAWSCWMVSLIHLRDIPGVKPATKHYTEAMYQILWGAIDPTSLGGPLAIPNPDDPMAVANAGTLQPIDFSAQFDLGKEDDNTAKHILDLVVRGMVDGLVHPDEMYRVQNAVILNTTVQHFASGRHKAPLAV